MMAATILAEMAKCEYIDELIISLPQEAGASIDARKLTLPGTAVISVMQLCDAAGEDECGDNWGSYTTATYVPDSMRDMNATQLTAWWPEGHVGNHFAGPHATLLQSV